MPHLLIMLGSGPGIGVGVASHFASATFDQIALVSRNTARLATDVKSVAAAAKAAGRVDVTVKAFRADVGDTASLEAALGRIQEELGPPEVVVFNAARVGGGDLFEAREDDVERDWKIATLGLYTTARIVMPLLISLASDPDYKPALLVTSGGLYKTAYHPYFSLSLSKASQHSLVMSLAQRFAKEGVHVAAVVVHGLVKLESEIFNPGNIAKTYWKLYEQGKDGEREVWITDGKGWSPVL